MEVSGHNIIKFGFSEGLCFIALTFYYTSKRVTDWARLGQIESHRDLHNKK